MIGVPPSPLALPLVSAPTGTRHGGWGLEIASGALVTLPVFLQAPWVRLAPFSATLFTVPLVAIGLALAHHANARMRDWGYLLVGFCGSWLGGCLFWGWCRLHPIWHLPLEAFVLPLALAGLGSRWRLACGFYLGSLVGTAATDGAMVLTGVMPLWPQVLNASSVEAAVFLQAAALQLLQPSSLLVVAICALGLGQLCRWLGGLGEVGRIAAAALATTLAVDGLFWLAALLAPKLSGLI